MADTLKEPGRGAKSGKYAPDTPKKLGIRSKKWEKCASDAPKKHGNGARPWQMFPN